MSLEKQKADLLIKKIEDVFSNTPYPGDEKLVDYNGDYFERKEIADDFKGKSGQEVQLPTLKYHHQALFFFTPEAYCYYLPAYMRVSVSNFKEAGNIPFTTIFTLALPEDDVEKKDFFLRISKFTIDQKFLIREFLEFMESEHGRVVVDKSRGPNIHEFWQQFR
jgi:hypothetical protein